MIPTENIQVYLFNVGQGDHILIKLPDGHYGVIDFYHNIQYNDLGVPPALTYLDGLIKNGEEVKIAFMHISHYHQDHLKGLEKWISWMKKNNISPVNLWLPGVPVPTTVVQKIINYINNDENEYLFLNEYFKSAYSLSFFTKSELQGNFKALDDYINKYASIGQLKYLNDLNKLYLYREISPIKIFCLAPSSVRAMEFIEMRDSELLAALLCDKKNSRPNQNDISSVLLINFDDLNLTFGGDAEIDSLEESIDNFSFSAGMQKDWGITYESDFIKLFHHGSKRSSTEKIWRSFIKSEKGTIIGISAGDHKGYNHPHQETFDSIKNACTEKSSILKLYSTNIESISKTRALALDDTEDTIEIEGDFFIKREKRKNKSSGIKLLDQTPLESNKATESFNNNLKITSDFLGYHFELEAGSNEIKVRRMIPKKEPATSE